MEQSLDDVFNGVEPQEEVEAVVETPEVEEPTAEPEEEVQAEPEAKEEEAPAAPQESKDDETWTKTAVLSERKKRLNQQKKLAEALSAQK